MQGSQFTACPAKPTAKKGSWFKACPAKPTAMQGSQLTIYFSEYWRRRMQEALEIITIGKMGL
jgi:hypothetical protein